VVSLFAIQAEPLKLEMLPIRFEIERLMGLGHFNILLVSFHKGTADEH
jgi:hypothetical protein